MKKVYQFIKVGFYQIIIVAALALLTGCSDYLTEVENSIKDIEVSYSVEHWLQNLDGKTYVQDEEAKQKLIGMSLSKTEVKPKEYAGYAAKKIEQKVISRDGTTIVKVYYDRKKITYTFDAAGGNWNSASGKKTFTGIYGESFVIPQDPSKTGYVFSDWDKVIPVSFGTQDIVFIANWTPGDDTPYTIEHYLQNIDDDNYTIKQDSTETKTGTTESMTNVIANTYTGFRAKEVSQQSIMPDGSTVIKVYYDRTVVTLTYKVNGGKWNDNTTADISVTGKYGTTVTPPQTPTKTGYTVSSWSSSIPATLPEADLVCKANWSANKYTIVFNGNGGSGSTANQVFYYDSPQNLSSNSFTRNTWGFNGWNTASNGSGTRYSAGQSINNLTSTNNAVINLYAMWTYPYELKHENKKLGFACDNISLNYTFVFSASAGGYSKTVSYNSGDTIPYLNFSEVPVAATKNGVTWTITVTAVNSTHNLRYSGSSSAQISNNQINMKIPSLTKQ